MSPLPHYCSRRDFIAGTSAAAAGALLVGSSRAQAADVDISKLPIVVFSKIYQELKLDYANSAALTAEAGLDGIDCPVRPGGQVLPEKVAEDLPLYAEILQKHRLGMPLLTTAILEVSSPHAEEILRTGKKLGAQFYRLGFIERRKAGSAADQVREVRAQLKDVAALNKELGLGGLLQNHSPSGQTYLGGDLSELRALVEGFDPAQIGVAFDIGHALIVHGDGWRPHFEALKPHLKIAYVKDAQRGGRWVPFGRGDIAGTGYFKLLKQMGYHAPISLHIEFDWSQKGKNKTREAMLQALRESTQMLKKWLAEA